MRLSLEPGVTVESGRYTALIAPPGLLVDLLAQPEVDRYTTLYLYGVSSRVLHRLPRRAPRLAVSTGTAAPARASVRGRVPGHGCLRVGYPEVLGGFSALRE